MSKQHRYVQTVVCALALGATLLAGCGNKDNDVAMARAKHQPANRQSSSVKGLTVRAPRQETLSGQAYRMVNDERLKRGMPALTRRLDLDAVAYAHARDLLRMNQLSHTGSNGSSLENRLGRVDWVLAGENLARNKGFDYPAQEAVLGWINSPMHAENMFRHDFTHTGMAAIYDANTEFTYFVQVFITPP